MDLEVNLIKEETQVSNKIKVDLEINKTNKEQNKHSKKKVNKNPEHLHPRVINKIKKLMQLKMVVNQIKKKMDPRLILKVHKKRE